MAGQLDPFPDNGRFLYGRSPLTQVVSQVRFPPVLKIDNSPVDFQEQVRQLFPLYQRQMPVLPQNVPAEVAQLLTAQLGGSSHVFGDEAGLFQLVLSVDSLALTCTRYQRWEDFSSKLYVALKALFVSYTPAFLTRLGLRYINVIDKDHIGLKELPWSALINPSILGEVALPEFEGSVQDAKRLLRVRFEDGSFLFQHGLEGSEVGVNQHRYFLDFDLYTDQRKQLTEGEAYIDDLHFRASRIFRWAITDELHSALDPSPC